jgi:hypothetical protein
MLSTSPLGHVAYLPHRDTWMTWINHVANVSATWQELTWHSGNVDSHPRGLRHVADCGHVDLYHVAIVSHAAIGSHMENAMW